MGAYADKRYCARCPLCVVRGTNQPYCHCAGSGLASGWITWSSLRNHRPTLDTLIDIGAVSMTHSLRHLETF